MRYEMLCYLTSLSFGIFEWITIFFVLLIYGKRIRKEEKYQATRDWRRLLCDFNQLWQYPYRGLTTEGFISNDTFRC